MNEGCDDGEDDDADPQRGVSGRARRSHEFTLPVFVACELRFAWRRMALLCFVQGESYEAPVARSLLLPAGPAPPTGCRSNTVLARRGGRRRDPRSAALRSKLG